MHASCHVHVRVSACRSITPHVYVCVCGRAGGHAGRFAAAVHAHHGAEELRRRHHVLLRRHSRSDSRDATREATCGARPRRRLRRASVPARYPVAGVRLRLGYDLVALRGRVELEVVASNRHTDRGAALASQGLL